MKIPMGEALKGLTSIFSGIDQQVIWDIIKDYTDKTMQELIKIVSDKLGYGYNKE